MDNFLSEIGKKVKYGSEKKFRSLSPEVKSSVLRISYNIAQIVGWDNVEVETEECDIFFKDGCDHYLEVKTPQFLKQDIGDKFKKINNEIMEIISTSGRKFLGFHFRENDIKVIEDNRIKIPNHDQPMGVINFDSSFIPRRVIFNKFNQLLGKAATQIEHLQGGKRMVIIDLGYNFTDIRTSYEVLKEVVIDTDIMDRLDGISLFYFNQRDVNRVPVPFNLGPTIINKLTNISKVFDHPYNEYSGNIMTLTPYLISLNWTSDSCVPQMGSFNLDKKSKKYFYETLSKLTKYDTSDLLTDKKRCLTLFY